MDNRYEIAEQNGMSREFADWFFDNKKAGCGNVWFMMMAAMWEGWQGRAAMLQGTDGNSPVIPDWQTQAEKMAELYGSSFVLFRNGESPQCADPTKVIISFTDDGLGHGSAAPQQEVK